MVPFQSPTEYSSVRKDKNRVHRSLSSIRSLMYFPVTRCDRITISTCCDFVFISITVSRCPNLLRGLPDKAVKTRRSILSLKSKTQQKKRGATSLCTCSNPRYNNTIAVAFPSEDENLLKVPRLRQFSFLIHF